MRHVPFPSLDREAATGSVALVSASKAWNIAGLKAALAVPGPAARAEVARRGPMKATWRAAASAAPGG